MRLTSAALTLALPLVLGGGAYAAEQSSGAQLTDALTQRIEHALPSSVVHDVNLRGRPFVVSRLDEQISTAYVEVSQEGAEATLIVQELDLATDTADRIRVLVTVPYGEATTHILRPDDSYSPRGRLADGTVVTYAARLDGTTLHVAATDGASPAAVAVPALEGLAVRGTPLTSPEGVLVELTVDDASLPR